MADNDDKEESVSISFSDKQEDDGIGTISFSLRPQNLNFAKSSPMTGGVKMVKGKNKKRLGAELNRRDFMSKAPSLMKLLNLGVGSKSADDGIVGKKKGGFGLSITNVNNADKANNDDEKKDESIVDSLLTEYNKTAEYEHNDEKVEMQILAKQAAEEFELLAQQNDDLFKEKEQFKQKYDDLNDQLSDLNEKMKEFEQYKEQYQSLTTENLKYKSQTAIFEQEKLILNETINDLKHQLTTKTNDNNMDNNKNGTYDITASSNNSNNQSNDLLMQQIAQLTKEKNELEHQMDEYKNERSNYTKTINELNGRLKKQETESSRLSVNLNKSQNQFLQLQQTKEEEINKLDRQLSHNHEQEMEEYQIKQQEFLETIENQKNHIDNLQRENQELQNAKASASLTTKDKKYNMNRLRTQANLFGGGAASGAGNNSNMFDADPFGDGGGGDDDYYDDEQQTFMDDNNAPDDYDDDNDGIGHGDYPKELGISKASSSVSDDEPEPEPEPVQKQPIQIEEKKYDENIVVNHNVHFNDAEEHGAQELSPRYRPETEETLNVGAGDFIGATKQNTPDPDANRDDVVVKANNLSCACFTSFFNKLNEMKNKNKNAKKNGLNQALSTQTPLSEQELR